MDVVFLAGRILFALIFLNSGLRGHLLEAKGSIAYAKSQNAPAPELLVPLSGVAILAGGLLVALGVWADLGALICAAFLLAMNVTMHAFWRFDDPQMRANQFAHFMKNLAVVGGALVIFWAFNQAQGAAPLSIGDPLFGRG